ncbi:MAG TPA: sulfite exporter TauE/SafE family protein, partial [Clostridia bacterium]|nr:sulfite exporter TauE/SafE family protein [Clostridia bacterium]
LVGGLGSVLFLSGTAKAVILALAALFMLLMGLSMLGWLPWWLTPRLPAFLFRKTDRAKAGKGPFVVGLLNGLMPCGPMQAMQLYALATGSALTGGLSMLLFSLGTVPLMLGAGVAFSFLKGRFTRVIQRVGAVLILFFAVIMACNAGALFGPTVSPGTNEGTAAPTPTQSASAGDETADVIQKALKKGYVAATIGDGVQTVTTELSASHYPYIIVEKGVPVEFTIVADKKAITGCNATVVMPAYGIEQPLEAGENVFSFTPDESRLVSYSCWMGMIPGKILVVDSLDSLANP